MKLTNVCIQMALVLLLVGASLGAQAQTWTVTGSMGARTIGWEQTFTQSTPIRVV
jgi:hypothetical protein